MLFLENLFQRKKLSAGEWFALVFFICVFAFMGRVAWMMFYPYQVLEPISLVIDQPTVKAGNDVTYTFSYSKHMAVPGRVMKRLENSIVIPYQDAYTNMPVGKKLFHRGTLHIPGSACKGEYRMVLDFVYDVNPLRTIMVSVASDKFTVVKDEKGKK